MENIGYKEGLAVLLLVLGFAVQWGSLASRVSATEVDVRSAHLGVAKIAAIQLELRALAAREEGDREVLLKIERDVSELRSYLLSRK